MTRIVCHRWKNTVRPRGPDRTEAFMNTSVMTAATAMNDADLPRRGFSPDVPDSMHRRKPAFRPHLLLTGIIEAIFVAGLFVTCLCRQIFSDDSGVLD